MHSSPSFARSFCLFASLTLLVSCAGSAPSNPDGHVPGGSGGTGGPGGSGGSRPIDAAGWDSGGYEAPPANLGTETTCDGLDENGNGITDDVDVGQDGFCDCLRIGVLGDKGGQQETGVFANWLQGKSSTPIAYIPKETMITADLLAKYDIIVLQSLEYRYPDTSTAEADVLATWVKNGGGLMTMSGYSGDFNGGTRNSNTLLKPLGFQYTGSGSGILGDGAPPTVVTGVVAGHPINDQVSAIGVYYTYTVSGDGDLVVKNGTDVLGVSKSIDKGRVFVFGDEWITYDSLWLERTDIQIPRWWLNVFKFLSPQNICQVAIPPVID